MARLKEIYQLVRKEFKTQKIVNERIECGDEWRIKKGGKYTGLCYVVRILEDHGMITADEGWKVLNAIKSEAKGRKRFYTHTNRPTRLNDQFLWKVGKEYKPKRLNWLDKRIAKLK